MLRRRKNTIAIAASAIDPKSLNKIQPGETAPGEANASARSVTDIESTSESKTEPKICEQQPTPTSDRDKAARNFYGPIISKLVEEIQPVGIEITAEEEERQWRRALLLWKVKKLEEEVKKLRGRPKHKAKTPKFLKKKEDYSRFFDGANLTAKQREVASLAWEYELKPQEIANRLNKNRKTIHDHLDAAEAKIQWSRGNEQRAKKRAVTNPENL